MPAWRERSTINRISHHNVHVGPVQWDRELFVAMAVFALRARALSPSANDTCDLFSLCRFTDSRSLLLFPWSWSRASGCTGRLPYSTSNLSTHLSSSRTTTGRAHRSERGRRGVLSASSSRKPMSIPRMVGNGSDRVSRLPQWSSPGPCNPRAGVHKGIVTSSLNLLLQGRSGRWRPAGSPKC